MAENMLKLMRKAVKAGMNSAEARKSSREELEAFLSDSDGAPVKNKKSVAKKAAKKAVKKAVAKKKASETDEPAAPAKKRGRPKGSKNKKAAPVKAAPVKKSPGRPKKNADSPDVGRATIAKVDYTVESDGWNPRKGSPVERIWRSLKKNRDNVDKVFAELKPKIADFVNAKNNDGTKRDKAKLEATLKYRINRTRFEYAVRTGQHKRGTARVKYGTGQYAAATKKAARKAKRNGTTKAPAKKKRTAKK